GHDGAFPFGLHGLASMAEDRVIVVEVRRTQPFVESVPTGVNGAGVSYRAEMPFAKMSRRITGCLECLGDRDLLGTDRVPPFENTHPVGMASGHDAGPSWRTNGRCRIKAVESQARRGGLVKM